jgi:hypothetical protein
VSGTAELLLGVIAVAVTVMALVQVGVIVAGLRVARRVERLAADLDERVRPILANLTAMSNDATRAASLAAAQVERFDHAFADLTTRVDQAMSTVQHFVGRPARQGFAVVAGVRAALSAFQTMRDGSRRRAARTSAHGDEEESLFIG